jgi:hypothetical protein
VSIAQVTPALPGKLSLTLSPVAVPALPLLRVTAKPICEPAFTLVSSETLLIEVVAHKTLSEAIASPETSLSVVKLAMLLYVAQLPLVVLLTTCTFALVLPTNVVGL